MNDQQPSAAGDREHDGTEAEHDDDLMPKIKKAGPAPHVLRVRKQQGARDELDRQQWEPRVQAHIAAHRLALDFLNDTHQWIADDYDFDLVGDTRPAATWQMAGRCIGIARLICDSLALGYTTEVLHLARALHEAVRLVQAFMLPEGTALLRKWLADDGNDWVRPKAVRAVESEFEERLAQAMRDAGIPELDRTRDLDRAMYGHQSEAAHHRRKWTQDAVLPPARTMLRGPTTVWLRRAGTTAAMLPVVEESVMLVGDALARFLPPDWYEQRVGPFLLSFEALRVTQPLS